MDVELKTFEEGLKTKKSRRLETVFRVSAEMLGVKTWLFESWSAEVRASHNCSKCFTLSFISRL